MLGHLLGYASVRIVNVFPLPSRRSTGISVLGTESTPWHAARREILPAVASADGALMAYGVGSPTGPAREHFRDQITWLESVVARAELPAWQMGDGPRHPSRWQRWTHREHPELDFPSALVASITRWSLQ
jgi:hypothetical protein